MSRAISPPVARLCVLLIALLASMGFLASLGTPSAAAAKPCWERVIDDWIDNGRIDARYSPACLQASLQHVPEDVRAYSDFEEKVKQAIQSSLRLRELEQVGGGSSGETPSETPGATETTGQAQRDQVERIQDEEQAAATPSDDGPIEKTLGYGNEDASSIPLPLMILAAFALLLLAAGASGIAHRKLQARKARSN
jgi:hypothetical protein